MYHPSPGLPTTLRCLQIGSIPGLKESVPFDPSGDPVPPILIQLLLIFFNQRSRRGFYPHCQLPLHVLLPHANLWVVGVDHPVAKIGANDVTPDF
jgi:hypothetical protein